MLKARNQGVVRRAECAERRQRDTAASPEAFIHGTAITRKEDLSSPSHRLYWLRKLLDTILPQFDMVSIALATGFVVLLAICVRVAYRAGFREGREVGQTEGFQFCQWGIGSAKKSQ